MIGDGIAIVGMGYVGLPLPLSFLKSWLRVIGLDVDPLKVTTLNSGKTAPLPRVRFLTGSLSTPGLLDLGESFATVTAWAVLEHTPDPDLALKLLAAVLSPRGHLHLTVPECGTSLTRFAAARTAWYYPPEHLHLLSPRAIFLLASRHGLQVAEWRHFELSFLRWCARYGIGLAEAVAGTAVHAWDPSAWNQARCGRQSRFFGITYLRLIRA